MIENVSTAAKTYLSAVGAAAIYVCVVQGSPVSVGVARDLDKALRHLRNIIAPGAEIGWVAWAMNYAALVRIAQTRDLMMRTRGDGVKVPLALTDLSAVIETMAAAEGVTLTQHEVATSRAEVYAGYVDETLAQLQRDGTFAAFNRAYKSHRMARHYHGESAQPFWAVMHDLRAAIIRSLVAQPENRAVAASAVAEIRKQFPWFTTWPLMRPAKRQRRRR